MNVRLVRTKARSRDGKMRTIYLATTLLDPTDYPSEEIAEVYRQRWSIEVRFRDIKTTLGLELLRARSPMMAEKMVRMVQIAFNLLKVLTKESIGSINALFDEIGFKRTIDLILEFRSGFRNLQNRPRLLANKRRQLEERIGEKILRIRPGRSKPIAVKQRPKQHQLLTAPRANFRELSHRGKKRMVA
jgi:hypothetical protein